MENTTNKTTYNKKNYTQKRKDNKIMTKEKSSNKITTTEKRNSKKFDKKKLANDKGILENEKSLSNTNKKSMTKNDNERRTELSAGMG